VFGRRGEPALFMASEVVPRTWSIEKESGGEGEGDGELEETMSFAGASLMERLVDKDFAELTKDEEAAVRSLIARMLWKPADVHSRRRRPVRQGDRPDLRRTLRRSVSADGDLLRIASTERRIRKRPLIFIADVSGSMERYSEMLLYFAHAARGRMGRMEAFVFSTRLTRITRELHRRDGVRGRARLVGGHPDRRLPPHLQRRVVPARDPGRPHRADHLRRVGPR
jgi:uncharacterized protein with von Willebrand factor type A (vWA) domain